MKIKFILILVTLLMQNTLAAAQLPTDFLLSGGLPIQNKQIFSANVGGKFDVLAQSKLSALANPLFSNSAANCSDSDDSFAPQAAPCNGVSVTSINFLSTSRSIVSGTNNTTGVVYKYVNAGTAPDGTVVDAWVTVLNYSNNMDPTPTTFSAADVVGDETTTNGYDRNLQPNIIQDSLTFTNAATWTGSINYRVNFYRTGTTTPIRLTVAATSIDNDGVTQGADACTGAALQESVTYSAGSNQILVNTPSNTTQTVNGATVTGPATNQAGIGIGNNFSNAALFVNVSQFDWTYSFNAPAITCANGTSVGTARRLGSLNLTCQITFDRAFASVALSGTVFNDTNGLTDSTVNGTGTGTPGGTQIYANLLDGGGFVVSSVAVAANGTYSFPTAVAGSYNIQLSTTRGVESSPAPAQTLPIGWVNTGEFLGAGAGNDGTVNGLLSVAVAAAAVTNANFGIEQRPTANNNAAPSQANPGGTISATVPATTFTVSDTAGGTVSSIRITAFPSNITSITINGVNYTSANFPVGGVIVPTNASGNSTQTILVDPVDGTVAVGISYVAIDNAGFESQPPATASVPFVDAAISGTVFNDTNGLTDSTVNGAAPGTNAGGPLYANLFTSGGVFIKSVLVTSGGAYTFSGLNTGVYIVQISTVQGSVGTPLSGTATLLPAGWVNTGENIGTGTGSDGTPNGQLSVTIPAVPTDVANANFGIEQHPTANNSTAGNQANPGGVLNGTVPAAIFNGTDPAPGTISSIRITAFPSNATTITINGVPYTSVTFPVGGVTIPADVNGNPTQPILVDPIDGAVTVVIRYVTIDNAGVPSSTDANAATAGVPFGFAPTAADGNISGTLRFGNNLMPNTLVVLIDTASNSKSFTRTEANGNYLFAEQETGRTYIVQPLSSKYSFSPGSSVVNLVDNAAGLNFNSTAKTYRPKNDFDGDGKSDVAVFRPTDGNWYVLKSSDAQMSVFNFGAATDVPVPADFDGDGETDYAVFRPTDGNWYIWQSATQDLRVERFGAADDKLVPADFDGDGKADVAVYRNGAWYVRCSSDGAFVAKNYGAAADTPITGDFDGDGKSDFSVYRPGDGIWYTLQSSNGNSSARRFGAETDVPVSADFDGDGFADIAQFRTGFWYILNSTTDFEASQFGTSEDKSIVGDYDGDGRADTTTFHDGLWSIRNSGSGTVRTVYFGFPTDVPVR